MPEAEVTAPVAAPATPAPAPAPTEAASPAPAPAPTEAAAPAPAAAEPESYTLEAPKELPDGLTVDETRLGALNEIAKTHKLPKEAAQAVLDLAIKQAKEQADAVAKVAAEWKDQVLKDPVLGKPEATAAVAKVVSAFGDQDLVDFLNDTGAGNHPALVRFVHKLSKVLSEDAYVPSDTRGSASTAPRDPAAILYGNTN